MLLMRTIFSPNFKYFLRKMSTVDPKQIEIFNRLSKEWWDPEGALKPLHAFNSVRIPWICNSLREIGSVETHFDSNYCLSGLSILDVGCGGGIMTEPLSSFGGNITGLDCNLKMINIAKLRAEKKNLHNLQYVHSSIEEHVKEHENKYDVVITSETIEHVDEQEMFLKCCIKCLKPGGSFFVTTNSKSFTSRFLLITLSEDILQNIPKGTHHYDRFVGAAEMKTLLRNENCATVSTSGLIYTPLIDKWFFIDCPDLLNYALHAIKLSVKEK